MRIEWIIDDDDIARVKSVKHMLPRARHPGNSGPTWSTCS